MAEGKVVQHIGSTYIDPYQILGLTDRKCSTEDINVAFNKSIKRWHPNRWIHAKEEDKTTASVMYIQINKAYVILTQQREKYDIESNRYKGGEKTFLDLKNDFDSVSANENNGYKKASRSEQDDFNKKWDELNRKRGFQMSKEKDTMDEKDINDALNRRRQERANEDDTLKPENLFGEGQMDIRKFNKLFEKTHKNKDNEKGLIDRNRGPMPFNGGDDLTGMVPFSELNDSDDPFKDVTEDEDGGDQYASLATMSRYMPQTKTTKDDLKNLNEDDNTYDDHNKNKSDFKKEMEQRMHKRNAMSEELKAKEGMTFFSTDVMYDRILNPDLMISGSDDNDFLIDASTNSIVKRTLAMKQRETLPLPSKEPDRNQNLNQPKNVPFSISPNDFADNSTITSKKIEDLKRRLKSMKKN